MRFIEYSDPHDSYNWINSTDTPSYRVWSNYAFQLICLYHIQQIKDALGIRGLISHTFSWKSQDTKQGAQIDLIIDRRDQVINLCEVKFSTEPYVITKSYARQLRQKVGVFRSETGTKKAIFLTMITTYGLHENEHSRGLVQNDLDMEILFG